ncbi:YfdQ family protein [Pseudomonas chlororaphis subsp. piscium]|nr:YfdQ family protein [Pseudomonas chlororaphis subsp. piscium]
MQEAINHLVTLAQTLGKPVDHPSLPAPFALVPDGVKLQDLEGLLPAPTRIRQAVKILDADTFIAYVNRFATTASVVFCDGPEGRNFRATLDYHQPGLPSWGQHVAIYQCPISIEWGRWKTADRKKMDQATFAEFFEENIRDITVPENNPQAPSAADMLEISRTLEAKKNISFRQGTRLDNGQVQLTYNEQIDGQAGEMGQLKIPEQFFIGVRPFLGGDAFCVPVRFRYRIVENRLVMWFELVRPDKVLEEAYTTVRAKIQGAIGEVPMYEATL